MLFRSMRFVQADLTHPLPVQAAYGFCADVMEHIPGAEVEPVLVNVLKACRHVFFQIALEDDICGKLVGHSLHLTVKPYAWWLERFNAMGCAIHWSQDCGSHCLFYVSAWMPGDKLVAAGQMNTPEEQIRANVKANIAGDWMQVEPHPANKVEVMILGGGPSLAGQEDKIRKLRRQGTKLICLNGTYNWCLERALEPSAVIVVDARPFNARFVHPPVEKTKYFVASQCDPSVLEGLPKDRTYLWHTSAEGIADLLQERYGVWYGIPGGSTVLLRAIPLLRLLGYKRFHLFGCDSCLSEGEHHAYVQTENDGGLVVPVSVGGRVFHCTTWMAAQAHEFMDTIKFLGDEIEIATYGDGLLNHILQTGALMEA